MAYASVYYKTGSSSFGQKWFHFKGPTGTISERAHLESMARRAAADRLDCNEDELICTGWTPVSSRYVYQK